MSGETIASSKEGHHLDPRFVLVRANPRGESVSRLPQPLPRVVTAARTSEKRKPKLLDQVREALRTRYYSPRTEKMYVY